MASSPANRQRFIQSAIEFLRLYGFDGLGLHWEYPGARGSPPEDKSRFTVLCQVSLEVPPAVLLYQYIIYYTILTIYHFILYASIEICVREDALNIQHYC
uniref:GH18 domain-containing protein n=1 Tax=Acanthochromis polyacanthus TaxID=80966 RepID=A0A3Q1F7R1_9TELE